MPPATPTTSSSPNFPSAKPPRVERIKRYLRRRWKELSFAIAATLAAAVMLWGIALQHWWVGSNNPALQKKEPITSPLTGIEVSEEAAKRPVTGIMIENSTDARPQSGVLDAGVVFEAVAEGGITRYLTLFQEARPAQLGPVRSLRPYYLDWVMGYDAAIGHVGGSAAAQTDVANRGAKDLDQFKYGSRGYDRVGFRGAPHNVYTNFDKLDQLNNDLGYTASSFSPYKRKKDSPVNPPNNTTLTFDFSGPSYLTVWNYDPSSNSYLRVLAGTPDIDEHTGKQLAAKNVVYIPMTTTYDGKYAVMATNAGGDCVVFRDGTSLPCKWSKPNYKDMLELKTAEGSPIELNRGQTWFAIVPAGRPVSY